VFLAAERRSRGSVVVQSIADEKEKAAGADAR